MLEEKEVVKETELTGPDLALLSGNLVLSQFFIYDLWANGKLEVINDEKVKIRKGVRMPEYLNNQLISDLINDKRVVAIAENYYKEHVLRLKIQ